MYKMNVINFIENHSDRPSIYSKDLKIEYFNINDIIIYENVNAFLIKESEHSRGSIFELVMQIKKNSKAIIFLITDTNSRGIRLTYLNIGVDIIFTKDLDSDEMYIEICKILNLINKEKISKYKNTEKPIFLVSDNRSIKLSEGKEVLLTKLEYKAMKLLVINKNKVLTYEQIFSHLWGGSSSNQNCRIANLIFHLRNKIKEKTNTNFIETIRSTGYMFVEENCYETTMDKLYERSN